MALVAPAAEGWTEKKRKVPEGADKGVLKKKCIEWIAEAMSLDFQMKEKSSRRINAFVSRDVSHCVTK